MKVLAASANDTKFSIFAYSIGVHEQLISYVDLKDWPNLIGDMQRLGHMPRLRPPAPFRAKWESLTYRAQRAQRLLARMKQPDPE